MIETFRAAVGRQTDVEVDFGVFLSGGIDSSLVSAVVRSLHPKRPLKAYTLRFEEESFDEGTFAEAVALAVENGTGDGMGQSRWMCGTD